MIPLKIITNKWQSNTEIYEFKENVALFFHYATRTNDGSWMMHAKHLKSMREMWSQIK